MQLDPVGIADSVVRNNMGVGGITLQMRGELRNDSVIVAGTGQRFPVKGAPSGASRPWLSFAAEGWDKPELLRLRWLGESDSPAFSAVGGIR